MDVFDYFDRVQRLCERRSLDCGRVTFAALHPSDDMRGRIIGHLYFEVDEEVTAYLSVSEVVEIRGNNAHRVEYGYFLVVDGTSLWGEERDLSHEPPIHRHGKDHERGDSEEIGLATVIDLAWEEVSDYVSETRGY